MADEIHTVSIRNFSKDEYISEISKLFQFPEQTYAKSCRIANVLLIKGRQSLKSYEKEFEQDVFTDLMKGNKMLSVLKKYNEQQWERTIQEEPIRKFLDDVKLKSPIHYDSVLTTIAECRSQYISDKEPLLSLTLRFLIKLDACTTNFGDNLFNEILDTTIREGRHGVLRYSEHFISEVSNNQIEISDNALNYVLKRSFEKLLKDLLEQSKVHITRQESFDIVLGCVMEAGCWNGLYNKKVVELLLPTEFRQLFGQLRNHAHLRPIEYSSTTNVHQHEYDMIKTCIDEHNKLQLSNLIEAGSLAFVNKTLKGMLDDALNDNYLNTKFSSFIKLCLKIVMLLLKRHENLGYFANNLLNKYVDYDPSISKPHVSLRMIIHILLLNADAFLSQKILSLLSKRNSVPFLQPSIRDNSSISYEIVSDVVHVWDDSVPLILSFGIGPCKGKSTLLNHLFQTSFETTKSSSIYFENTIDIDFSDDGLPHRVFNIADAHGSLTKTTLQRIHELFDGFLIHVEYRYLISDFASFLDILNFLANYQESILLIVRDVPEKQFDACRDFLSKELSPTAIFLLPDISVRCDRDDKDSYAELRDTIKCVCSKRRHEMRFIENKLRNLIHEQSENNLEPLYSTLQPLEQILFDETVDEKLLIQHF